MRRHSAIKGRAAKGAASMCIGVGQGIATLWGSLLTNRDESDKFRYPLDNC
jgi:hypothetical protein